MVVHYHLAKHRFTSSHGVPSQPFPFKTRLPLLPTRRMQHLRPPPPMGERRALRPPVAAAAMAALKCPRCESANTKFCYYNNYNLSQPRHFCKSCRRYWTNGGVLRNVPVGGGCRKPKRPRSSSSPSSSSSAPAKPTFDQSSSSSSVPINPESAPPAGGFALAFDSSYLGSSALASSQPGKKVADAGDGDDGVAAVEAASLPAELAGVEWPAADVGDQGLMEFSGAIEQSYNWGCQNVFQTQTQIQWCEMDQISSFYFP